MDRSYIRRVLSGMDPDKGIPKKFAGDAEDNAKIEEIMKLNGRHTTVDICCEELSELIKEVTKADRYMGKCSEDKKISLREGLEEEIADVFVIINYIKRMHDINMENVARIMTLKLDDGLETMRAEHEKIMRLMRTTESTTSVRQQNEITTSSGESSI